jgi:hypothetical protein
MGPPTMHRLAAFCSAALLLTSALLLLPGTGAGAQEPAVNLTLVRQTPWNSTNQRELEVTVRAVNTGTQTLASLSVGWTLWGPVFTRTDYERSLVADPDNAIALGSETISEPGTLAPGQASVFRIPIVLDSAGISTSQSLVYPLKIDLRTGYTSIAAIRTPVIFLVRRPLVPLDLTWTFVLDAPIAFAPDSVFTTTALEQELGPGGSLSGEIAGLLSMTRVRPRPPIDLAVSPVLLMDLARMRSGYSIVDRGRVRQVKAGTAGAAAAGRALADLKELVGSPEVELSALPFSDPSLPAMAAGLSRDLSAQLERGRELVASVLGGRPDPRLLRPPGSVLDQASLDQVAARGVGLVFMDPAVVPPPAQPLGFAPPATASLRTGERTLTAIVPDPDVQAMLSSDIVTEDPVRAAQGLLGELAAIWLEQPSIERGLAVTFPETFDPPGAFFGAVVNGMAGAPWLRKTPATTLAQAFPPPEPSQLSTTTPGVFPRAYTDAIKQTHRQIDTYRSMLVADSAQPDRIESTLLLAESGQFVPDPSAGTAFIQAAQGSVRAVFGAVRPDAGQVITLTSSAATGIPVRVSNANGEPLKVSVRLVSPHLKGTPQSSMILKARATQTVTFDVRLNTTGRFPVDVEVTAPSGRVISNNTLIVRSTAYNRIALFITVGAALLALAVWARRFLPRRTS